MKRLTAGQIDEILENSILNKVSKPTRYLGSEFNAVHKDWEKTPLKVVLAFPDVYDVGMSHLGLKILYEIINEREDALAERVCAPWPDMERCMRETGLPLFSLESRQPLTEFDMIGFTMQYEMSYTNILNMLDLAGIPLTSRERAQGNYPLIMAGGPGSYNPEPMAEFFDFFAIGEGEEMINDKLDVYSEACRDGASREETLLRLSRIPGIYVPEFYEAGYREDGFLSYFQPLRNDVPTVISKRVIDDFDMVRAVRKPVVPFMDIVHDRITMEIMRGCTRGCRFCQAGMLCRPVRERRPETLAREAKELIRNTGYDEISLSSLSSSDYSCISRLVEDLLDDVADEGVGISLPSLRIDSFSLGLAQKVQKVRRSSLTFAPEAGTQRLRDIINKGVSETDLEQAVKGAFGNGWTTVKLYFMIGLPGETQEDLDGIADLAYKTLRWGEEAGAPRKRMKVTVSASSFVPKPQTPFQWLGQNSRSQLLEKQHYLKSIMQDRRISFNWHESNTSFLEAVFSRGDRRLSVLLKRAWELGATFDAWTEHFDLSAWKQAIADTAIDAEWYAQRRIPDDAIMPWDHIDCGVSRKYLLNELKRSVRQQVTPDCRQGCTGCGVCSSLQVEPRIYGEIQ